MTSDLTTGIYLYDDSRARSFEPFALTRPICTLVAGAVPVYRRWEETMRLRAAGFISAPHLDDFVEPPAPAAVRQQLPAGSIIVNSRFIPALTAAPPAGDAADSRDVVAWRNSGRVAAIRLSSPLDLASLEGGEAELERFASDGQSSELDGWWHDDVWDFIGHLGDQLSRDVLALCERNELSGETIALPTHVSMIGKHRVVIAGTDASDGEQIEPNVVLDATAGPIFIGASASIRAFTRLAGPCYVGDHSSIMGGDVSGCSIGPISKIRGEISSTIVLGYSNKGHDGFVGHSYLGRWVNLGAGTVTSNLKNTYGPVSIWTPGGVRQTGLQFLGSLIGDHVKTGIGTTLTTGAILGAGANVFGGTMPAKTVSPFGWGATAPYAVYDLEKFLEGAERMMSRRHVDLTEGMRRVLAAAHSLRWTGE